VSRCDAVYRCRCWPGRRRRRSAPAGTWSGTWRSRPVSRDCTHPARCKRRPGCRTLATPNAARLHTHHTLFLQPVKPRWPCICICMYMVRVGIRVSIRVSICSTHTGTAGNTRSSAIVEGPRDASCQLKSCQLPRNSAETHCTTSPGPSISCR